MTTRKKLSDILHAGGNGSWIDNDNWDNIPPAPDFGTPVPRGHYLAHIIDGSPFNAGTGTPGFKIAFEIIEGEFSGRRLWYDIWLTDAAKSGAVRDFRKLGVQNRAQLEQGIPPRRVRCKILVVVRQDNDGIERNVVKTFDVVSVDPPPPPDTFAPSQGDLAHGEQGDTSFDPSGSDGPRAERRDRLFDDPPSKPSAGPYSGGH